MSRRLEEFSIFPLIAWMVVIGFAVFTFTLALKLYSEDSQLGSHTVLTEEYLRTTQ